MADQYDDFDEDDVGVFEEGLPMDELLGGEGLLPSDGRGDRRSVLLSQFQHSSAAAYVKDFPGLLDEADLAPL